MGTGKIQQIQIKARSGLGEEEIQKMVKDAELNAEVDKKKREAITLRNDLDSMVYQTEKLVKDNESKFAAADVKSANDMIADAKKIIARGADAKTADIKGIYEKLQNITQKLSTDLYKQQTNENQAQAPAGGPTDASAGGGDAGQGGDDNVIDADYKDVN